MLKRVISIAGCLAAIGLVHSPNAFSEPYGLINGRSVNFDSAPQMSIEGGIQLGDDFEHFGARLNYLVSPTLQAYADFGQSTLDFEDSSLDADGLTFGAGVFLSLDSIVEGADFAVHGSFHTGGLEFDRFDNDVDVSALVIEGVFSGQNPLGASGNLFWNANIGIARVSADVEGRGDDSETELMFGGGVTMPVNSGGGELYGGINYIDGLGFGAGYRHFLD